MVFSTRSIIVTGLGFVGLGLLTGRLLGQQADDRVSRTATPNPSATKANVPPATVPPVVGTIDMERVLKEYEKFKYLTEEFQASVLTKKNELMKLAQEGQQNMDAMQKFNPGSPDAKKFEDKITFIKAQMEAKKESAQREFEMKEADSLATLYKEIQEMSGRVAQWRKMNYILKVSSAPVSGGDPKSVMAAMSSTVIYSDSHNDISTDVIYWLNKYYRANGGQAPKTPASAARTPQQAPDAAGVQPAAVPAQATSGPARNGR